MITSRIKFIKTDKQWFFQVTEVEGMLIVCNVLERLSRWFINKYWSLSYFIGLVIEHYICVNAYMRV